MVMVAMVSPDEFMAVGVEQGLQLKPCSISYR
jgi:hypothetical protein